MSKRYDFLFEKYSKKLEHFYDETLKNESGKNIPKETQIKNLFKKLWDLDPTRKKSRVDAIIQWYVNSSIKDEDLYKITENITFFENHKHLFSQKDLLTFKTYQEFFESLQPILEDINANTTLSLSENQKEKLYKKEMLKQSIIREETDTYILLTPLTEEASCYWGRGTQWCTASTRSQNMFDSYSRKGPLYILIEKKTIQNQKPTKYQFHINSQQYMTINDTPLKENDIQKIQTLFVKNKRTHLQDFCHYISLKEDRKGFYKKFKSPYSVDLYPVILENNVEDFDLLSPQDYTHELLEKIAGTQNFFQGKSYPKKEDVSSLLTENIAKLLRDNNNIEMFVDYFQDHPNKKQEILKYLEEDQDLLKILKSENITLEFLKTSKKTHLEIQEDENWTPFLKKIHDHYKDNPEYIDILKHCYPNHFLKYYRFSDNPDIKKEITELLKRNKANTENIEKEYPFSEKIKYYKNINFVPLSKRSKSFQKITPKSQQDAQRLINQFPNITTQDFIEKQPFWYLQNIYIPLHQENLKQALESESPIIIPEYKTTFEELCLKAYQSNVADNDFLIKHYPGNSELFKIINRVLDILPKKPTHENTIALENIFYDLERYFLKNNNITEEKRKAAQKFFDLLEHYESLGYSSKIDPDRINRVPWSFYLSEKKQPNLHKKHQLNSFQNSLSHFTLNEKENSETIKNILRKNSQSPDLLYKTNFYKILFSKKTEDALEIIKLLKPQREILYALVEKNSESQNFEKNPYQRAVQYIPLWIILEDYETLKNYPTALRYLTLTFLHKKQEISKEHFEKIQNDLLEVYQNDPKTFKDLFKMFGEYSSQVQQRLSEFATTLIDQSTPEQKRLFLKSITENYEKEVYEEVYENALLDLLTDHSQNIKFIDQNDTNSHITSLLKILTQYQKIDPNDPYSGEKKSYFYQKSNSDLFYAFEKTTPEQRQNLANLIGQQKKPFENSIKKLWEQYWILQYFSDENQTENFNTRFFKIYENNLNALRQDISYLYNYSPPNYQILEKKRKS